MRPLLITGYVGPYYILQLHQTGFSKWKCKTVHFLPQSANINLLRHKDTQHGHNKKVNKLNMLYSHPSQRTIITSLFAPFPSFFPVHYLSVHNMTNYPKRNCQLTN